MSDTRHCNRCGQDREPSQFGANTSCCKPCKAAYERDKRASRAGVIRPEDIARFWSRVKKGVPGPLETHCWIWQGAPRNHEGYGQFHIAGRNHAPHTIVLMLLHGIQGSRELFADHICRVRMCCNPDHLRLVTPRQNALENNDSPLAKNSRKTTCPRGHPLSGDNIAIIRQKNPKGTSFTHARQCLTCYPTYRNNPNRVREKEAR